MNPKNLPSEDIYYVYILKCNNDSYYTGIAKNVQKRFEQHEAGKGAKYTRAFGAKEIIFTSDPLDHSSALSVEYQLKKLTRAKKEQYIKDND